MTEYSHEYLGYQKAEVTEYSRKYLGYQELK